MTSVRFYEKQVLSSSMYGSYSNFSILIKPLIAKLMTSIVALPYMVINIYCCNTKFISVRNLNLWSYLGIFQRIILILISSCGVSPETSPRLSVLIDPINM